ncbi:MAG: hypothetical protein ACM32J_03335 [Rhizobacter sp.]|jgi:hypothetical protein
MTRYPTTTASAFPERRPGRCRRSATYHRMAAASRGMHTAGAGRASVCPTRLSLLQRALRSFGL